MSVATLAQNTRNAVTDKWDFLVQADRVHRSVYTDSDIFKREMVNIFGSAWVFVGHESEIPRAHDFVTRRFGGRPIILTRDRAGEIHILFNRCAHKGAKVCRADKGSAKMFVCPYHAWSYNLSGRSVSVPLNDAYAHNPSSRRYNLLQVPRVATYRGFIFGTLNAQAPDIETYLAGGRGPFDDWIDRYDGGEIRVTGTPRYRMAANWKFVTDNQGDGYHPAYSHLSLLAMTSQRYGADRDMSYFARNVDQSRMFVKCFENGHFYADQRPEMFADSAWAVQRPQPGREHYEAELYRRYGETEAQRLLELAIGAGMNLNIFPNLLLIGNQIQLVDPITVDKTDVWWLATSVADLPDEINTLRMRTQEDFPMFGEVDDVENFEACQEGLGIVEDEWVDCSRHLNSPTEVQEADGIRALVTSDLTMRTFYREWQRLMRSEVHIDLSAQREGANA